MTRSLHDRGTLRSNDTAITVQRCGLDEAEIAQFYLDVGRRVRAARSVAGLTQAQLADRVGLRRSSIANLEAGRQRFLLHFVAAIAGALAVAVDDLVPTVEVSEPSLDFDRLDDATAQHPDIVRSFVLDAVRSVVEGDRSGPT